MKIDDSFFYIIIVIILFMIAVTFFKVMITPSKYIYCDQYREVIDENHIPYSCREYFSNK